MKLNLDCVRDVLLAVEACGLGEFINLDILADKLPAYEKDDIHYACLKLKEGGLLQVLTSTEIRVQVPQVVEIRDITYTGHEFLNSIREDTTWAKAKNIAKKSGGVTIKLLGDIAKELIKRAMLQQLQLGQ